MTPDFQAHYRCYWCHAVRPKTEVVFCDDQPVCRDNPTCKENYYARNHPRPVPRSASRFEHG